MICGDGGILNDHHWYRLISLWDYARALLWCVANFVTFLSYLLIPLEIRKWRIAIPFTSMMTIGALFIAFTTLCGVSHLVMIVIMPTAPWWANLIYVPMAVVSVLTVAVLRFERGNIVTLLEAINTALRKPPDA